jgi:hypothetical protein
VTSCASTCLRVWLADPAEVLQLLGSWMHPGGLSRVQILRGYVHATPHLVWFGIRGRWVSCAVDGRRVFGFFFFWEVREGVESCVSFSI